MEALVEGIEHDGAASPPACWHLCVWLLQR
jgi:hypothetical protein